MDPTEVMEYLEDNDEVLASIQTTIALLLRRRNAQGKRAESVVGRERTWNLEGDRGGGGFLAYWG